MENDNNQLVKGGQGRRSCDIIDSAFIVFICAALSLAILVGVSIGYFFGTGG